MAPRLVPSSRSQYPSVLPVSRKGRPDEKPRSSITATLGWPSDVKTSRFRTAVTPAQISRLRERDTVDYNARRAALAAACSLDNGAQNAPQNQRDARQATTPDGGFHAFRRTQRDGTG